RKVTVSTIKLRFASGPALALGGMQIAEDPGFGDGRFLDANQVTANIDPVALFRQRRISIRSMKIDDPQLQFVKNTDGEWSWGTLGAKSQSQNAGNGDRAARFSFSAGDLISVALPAVSTAGLRHLQIEHASVTLTDKSTGQSATYKNITLTSDLSPHHSGSE